MKLLDSLAVYFWALCGNKALPQDINSNNKTFNSIEEKTGPAKTHDSSSQTVEELSELVSHLQQRECELEKKIQGLTRAIELIKTIYQPEAKN